jgi:hypothetical protein
MGRRFTHVHDCFRATHRASPSTRPASSTSWTPQWPTSVRCGRVVLLPFLCMHALLMPVVVLLQCQSHVLQNLARTIVGTCFETCRRAACSNAVRPAACAQVLNCIDYLHKFGYSKEQVGGYYHDVFGVRHIPKHDLGGQPYVYTVHAIAEPPAHRMWSGVTSGMLVAHACRV